MSHHDLRILLIIVILAKANPESIDDYEGFTTYVPSTNNFDDIYATGTPNSEDNKVPTEDVINAFEDSVLYRIPSQLVEFHAETAKPSTVPPPRYLFDSSMLHTTPKPPDTTTTEDPENIIDLVPIRKIGQRGVLDLIFPETRVKTFKAIFDAIKRILSHTFKR